jgi:uncharacterized membrane protein HdeD (DUF308 family)
MSIIDGIKSNARTAKWVGILLIVAGIVAMFAPLGAGLAVVTLIGVLLVFAGFSMLILAFRAGSFGDGLMLLLLGVLSLLAGLYMLFSPGAALATLTLFLAAYFVVSGVVEVIYAFQVKPVQGWGSLLFAGAVSVLLGILLWRQFPLSGAWAVGVLVGVRLLMNGFELMAIGGAAGGVADALDEAAGG